MPTKKSKNAGFSYIEVLIALALLTIIMMPILPALNQARANHRSTILRHQAQGQAVALALEIREAPGNASVIVQQAAANDDRFIYRVRLVGIGDIAGRQYTAGDVYRLPPADHVSFQTGFGDLFGSGVVVVAEVFDSDGNLAGLSVGKVN